MAAIPPSVPEQYALAQVKNLKFRRDGVHVELWYPRTSERLPQAVVVGLMDTRAADSIRISYDFDRDGWVVQQAKKGRWEAGDTVCDPEWTEVGFFAAWALQEDE